MVYIIVKHGLGALSAKLDLVDAFNHILVRSQDCPALGLSLDLQLPDGAIVYLHYVQFFLPFELHSSLALFNEYADSLWYAMHVN